MKPPVFLTRGFSCFLLSAFISGMGSSRVSAQVTLPDTFEGGFKLTRPIEYYNPQNLYELIDGQAVFYLSYGFVKLHHAFYQAGKNLYKVDVYQVQDDLSALGCLREQRDETAKPLDAGAEAYILDYLSALYRNVHYVEIVPESNGNVSEMTSLAKQIAALLPGTTTLPRELALFPQDGLIEGSPNYFGQDLLSYTFLGRGLSANYRQNGADRELRVFISLADNTSGAQNMRKQFSSRLTKPADVKMANGTAGTAGELPYRGSSMLFTFDRFAFGCIGVTDQKQALSILEALQANLSAYIQQEQK